MATDSAPTRSDAQARATSLVARARGLRRAQAEVQELTVREVQVMAKTAASFFDAIPLVELTPSLMPHTVRGLHRIRHRIVQRTIEETGSGMQIRALLLGRDGVLRLFSARSADSRDLLQILEPGRVLPAGVTRDVVDWSPLLRVDGFRPFEILDRLSASLDAVEQQITVAEERVQVQKAALTSGNLAVLKPVAAPPRSVESVLRSLGAGRTTGEPRPPLRIAQPPMVEPDPLDLFVQVEQVADAVRVPDVTEDEPQEWDDPPRARPPRGAAGNDRVTKQA
ncbi:MAG: hypothetical protein IT355_19170 [Gemmatimonadaceae bacterium]|nr:hypothetical protein [Gemmatimonadaceae bacterium]